MIDINKKYETRDGCPVRIYAIDAKGDKPIHGSYFKYQRWVICLWMENGCHCYPQSLYDLIEVKPRVQKHGYIAYGLLFEFNKIVHSKIFDNIESIEDDWLQVELVEWSE